MEKQAPKPQKKQVQIIILGDSSVGKTSIIKKYHDNQFDESHNATLGLDLVSKQYTTKDGSTITIKIWDTAGHERFHTMTQTFYKKADGIIIAYDMCANDSFSNVTTWLNSISQHAGQNIPRILVGNKCDLDDQRAVPYDEALKLANENGINCYETSAKTGQGLAECMDDIFEQSYRSKYNLVDPEHKPRTVSLSRKL